MRTITTTEQTYTKTHITVTCTCGAKGEGNDYDSEVIWDVAKSDCEVVLSTGIISEIQEFSHGEIVSIKKVYVDVCPKCFQERVLPALQALGFEVEVSHE